MTFSLNCVNIFVKVIVSSILPSFEAGRGPYFCGIGPNLSKLVGLG